MASIPARKRTTIEVLQAGRGLAALAVVASHMVLPTVDFVEPLPGALRAAMEQGYLGVDFFFVLSGFIIYYVNRDAFRQPGWSRKYFESRLTRIYVPYWPVAIALGLFYMLLPQVSQSGQPWSWPATLTLIPFGSQSALGVAWTLTYELNFYLLALLFFLTGRPLACGAVWAAAILLRQMIGGPFEAPVDLSFASVMLNPINLEFVFGMFAARLAMDARPLEAAPFLAAAAVCFAVFALDGFDRAHSFVFGLGVACMVVPLVRAELDGRLRAGRAPVLVGDASYAIYLTHMPLMSVVARASGGIEALDSWQANLLCSLAAAIGVGLAWHLFYEKPALRYARHLLRRRTPTQVPAAPAGAADRERPPQ